MSRQITPQTSLENLKREAKRWVKALRANDGEARARLKRILPDTPDEPGLRHVQHALAVEHGFNGWIALKNKLKHLHSMTGPAEESRLRQFERLAEAFVKAHSFGDSDALQRLSDHFARAITVDEVRKRVSERLKALRSEESEASPFSVADARLIIARQYGFESWSTLVESLTTSPAEPTAAPLGISTSPPFYKIDWNEKKLEVRPPMSDSDWDTVFGVMEEFGLTALDAGGQMTDAAIERMAHLDGLTRLNFGGMGRLTDGGLQRLAGMPQLEELDLSDWHSPITDRGLEFLRHLPELKRLQMCWPQRVTDLGVANLAFCDKVESVDLLGTQTGDGAIAALAGKERLRRFKTGRLVTDDGIQLLHQFPVFQHWQGGQTRYSLMSPDAEPNHLLLDGPFTDAGLASLAGLDGLFGLSFFWHCPAFTSDGLEVLKALPNLGFLGCQDKNCDDKAMLHISTIPKLRMLMAQGTVAGDEGFASLSRSQTIEYIWGRECSNLGSRGFRAMAAMPALRGLAVSCKNVDDSALSTLPSFPSLQGLMPMDVADKGFRHIGRCENLEELWCMYCRDTGDAATEQISGLTRLRSYYAGATQITDRSLEMLGEMTSLERIEFWECTRITNAGITHLSRLPRLREMTLGGSPRVTRDGMTVFPSSVRVNYW